MIRICKTVKCSFCRCMYYENNSYEIDPNHFILTTSGGIKQMQQFPIILSVINRNFMYKVFIFSFSVKWHLSDVFNLTSDGTFQYFRISALEIMYFFF